MTWSLLFRSRCLSLSTCRWICINNLDQGIWCGPPRGLGEQGNKANYFRGTREQKSKTEGNRGTKAILGKWEHRKSRFWFWGTRENANFFRGTKEQVPALGGLSDWLKIRSGCGILIYSAEQGLIMPFEYFLHLDLLYLHSQTEPLLTTAEYIFPSM